MNNLNVEYLGVVDKSFYNRFVALYGNLNQSVISQHIKNFFSVLVNGVRRLLFKKKNKNFNF